ncbi:MAG: LysR family transcriptional regulator [Polyangiaceae bacterium]
MAVELTHLRYFLEVRTRGSLTAAAKALGVSQPTLTVAIQRLEKDLRTTLLLRGRSGVTLTATGRSLAHDAEEVFSALDRAEARIQGLEDRDIGRFVLGCHEPLGAYFLPSFLRKLYLEHPGLDVALWNGPSAAVRDAIVARDVDFGLVVNPSAHPDLVLVDLFRDAVDFFVAAESDGVRRKRNTVGAKTREEAHRRVRKGPLIHAGRVSESQELLRALEKAGVVPEKLLSCGDFELVKALTMAGVGVGVLPRRVAAYGHDGLLLRLHADMPSFGDRIFLVYRADMHKTRAALRFKQALVDHGKELRGAA